MPTHAPTYRYPDPGDLISQAGVDRSGIPAAEWARQEIAILQMFADCPLPTSRRRLLDYGSGEGRLLAALAAVFDTATAFEPDPVRMAGQLRVLSTSDLRERVEPVAQFDPDTDPGGYDLAVCSHVLQHVAVDDAERIVGELATALCPGGNLLIFTTVAPWRGGRYQFTLDHLGDDGSVVEPDLTKAEFDAAFHRNTSGELPVRFFSMEAIAELAERHGLRPLFVCGFHGPAGVVGPITAGVTAVPDELYSCRDLALVATRREH